MHIFQIRDQLIHDYKAYTSSFIQIRDQRIKAHVEQSLDDGMLWPEPLIQLNPSFEPGEWIDELVDVGVLHQECRRIFRKDKDKSECLGEGRPLRLHRHQSEAIRTAHGGHNYVLTTGTGSGKSLAYIVPIVDHVLRRGSGRGIQAIVVYPMNALANSQYGELEKFLCYGYPDRKGPVTFALYTGQESEEQKNTIIANPPDILLTNYVMLELVLTRPREKNLIQAAQGLQFLVLDELHTYRGRQGADVALLVRRVRDALAAPHLQCVGTSATLAGVGTYDEQRKEVATVASLLFGAEVHSAHIIGETLQRATPATDITSPSFVAALTQRIAEPDHLPPTNYRAFVEDPLSIWIESTFGIRTEPGSGRLVRARPRSLSGKDGAAQDLGQLTGVPEQRCIEALQEGLLAGYTCKIPPETRFPPFAFRLHQFISRGDMVYASLEPEDVRHVTVYGQQYVPGDRTRVLLPLVFCRECGQEYYCVRAASSKETKRKVFTSRDLTDRFSDEEGEPGFVYLSTTNPWPSDPGEVLQRLPDDWLEEYRGVQRVRSGRRDDLPQQVRVGPDGQESDMGIACYYLPAPFRFCLSCGVAYGARQASDIAKLASLGSGGRSTATTILSLSTIRSLQNDQTLPERACKLLSFTDNRQDASLQAGHFNDFIEIGRLRSALYRAVRDAGLAGLSHTDLTQKVFEALNLPLERYASNPSVRFRQLEETQRALREVLGYRLYRDLRRGWRIFSPNLEQCGLLEMQYLSLDEVSQTEDVWQKCHPALVSASTQTRRTVARVLLDYMRRELAIKVDALTPQYQERIQQLSSQYLIEPWALDENEVAATEHAAILFPRSAGPSDYGGNVYLSARGGFGQYLGRSATFPQWSGALRLEDRQTIIRDLLTGLHVAGLVEIVREPNGEDEVPGYQLPASAMRWVADDGTRAFHDPIRMPNAPASGGRTNPFFVDFYRTIAAETQGLEAREHTAQVPYELRLDREDRFRQGQLPILYCSPTMELGVDIAELNVVNLRNIPPTPANYAQRSGRAGRSGQPALVFAYCATGSPHDQYFFKRPDLMVAGAVSPPRLDLANEDLVRAHIHAIWLAETGLSLGKSLKDILDLAGEDPSLALLESVRVSVEAEGPKRRARERATHVLVSIADDLRMSDWYTERWLEDVLAQVGRQFEQACERWRSLYRAALSQAKAQDRIIRDASRSLADKNQAERLRREAEAQLKLLTEAEELVQSDFYSYRYFASEGFLPGYSFPRLPLSAYIPGRRTKQRDEFLSRPRFLAISEFGPRSIVYHEGSRYLINKVILPVDDEELLTRRAKQCAQCGYLHPITDGEGLDLCERCKTPLGAPLTSLLRLQNVSTKRRDKINSDEEERVRLGYDIVTGFRFAEMGGRSSSRIAALEHEGTVLGHLTYGHATTLWRINLGWRRRRQKEQYGFVLDTERGYWARNEQMAEEDQDQDPMSARATRVIPYVEDRRNCLLFEPAASYGDAAMASLQAALKSALQVQYQLEDNELAAEPLPGSGPQPRRLLLFYESAEGGAGVLRRLLDDPQAFAGVAREALRLCHFNPDTGEDEHRAPRATEDCEAACYDCLMEYYNQRDHPLLDRQALREFLPQWTRARVASAPASRSRTDHLDQLLRLAGSELERQWLHYVEEHGYRLPSHGQRLIEACATRPDFFYETEQAAIYIDGPPHDFPERRARDAAQTECLEDYGYLVIRFGHQEAWVSTLAQYPHIFGRLA